MAKITKWRGKELEQLINKNMEKRLDKVGADLAGEVKKAAPVDTGKLRDSIIWQRKNDTVVIAATAEYALYVEQGTRTTRPQPFLRNTLAKERKEIEKDISRRMF